MFIVDPATKKITLHRGDTGEVTFKLPGETFGEDDRAMFTMKDGSGTEIIKRYFELDTTDDNSFTLEFTNSMTDYLTPGTYRYDVRYIKDPEWEGSGENAQIVDNEDGTNWVYTPDSPYFIEILDTVGQI